VGDLSYPILYNPTETDFSNNGLGILGDCASCFVIEEANGAFELSMQYPMDGIHFEEIQSRSLIKAKPDQFREPQLFRVCKISKPSLNGIVNIYAQHISYDLSGIPVAPFTADGVAMALDGLKSNAVAPCPFTFWTDKGTSAKFTVPQPSSIRSRLGGVEGSILDVFGGEYEFDNFTVKLHNNRGMDRGVSIRYGKNLLSLKQEENCQNIATGIYPYWKNPETGDVIQLQEKVIYLEGDFGFEKIRTVDFTSYFQEPPTEEKLRKVAENYIKNNELSTPIVSIDLSFVQLQKSEEYKHLQLMERVSLFDTIKVEFPELKVNAKAKAVKIRYNVLLDRVEDVSVGSVRANIADTIVEQKKKLEQAPTKTDLQLAKEAATAWLTNGKGYKMERRADDGSVIDTLYMDTPDINTAVNILRIGQSGIGFSHNGVNGPYISAWTIDGHFVADFITAGTLNAALVKVINLIAEQLSSKSANGRSEARISGAVLEMIYDGKTTAEIYNEFGQTAQIYIYGYGDDGEQIGYGSFNYHQIELGGNQDQIDDHLVLGVNDFTKEAYLCLPNVGNKKLSWKDNGDGTYTLIGK
jgi:phage minor structural protein